MKKPVVVFVCVHNSCRSQIAEALGKYFFSDEFDFYSAGTVIKGEVNSDALRLLNKKYGIDISGCHPKLISEVPTPDIAISMGCDVGCPYIGRKFDHNWGLPDPTGKSDAFFLDVISSIKEKVLSLPQKHLEK